MQYKEHLTKDKRLKKLIDRHEGYTLKKRKNLCIYLWHWKDNSPAKQAAIAFKLIGVMWSWLCSEQ